MRFAGMAVVLIALVGGCGGDDGAPSRSPEETAQAWVDAVNAEDYDRACDLSIFKRKSGCLALMREKPFGDDLEIERFYLDVDEGADGAFAISSRQERKQRGDGWTAYAPVEGFRVERDDGEYRVHFEVSVIK